MNKRTDKSKQRRSSRSESRKNQRANNVNDWAGYQVGDAIMGGPAFNPMTGKFELDLFDDPTALQIVGNPANSFGEPVQRAATLDDCVDDCPLCQQMREQILAGNPPQVLAFD